MSPPSATPPTKASQGGASKIQLDFPKITTVISIVLTVGSYLAGQGSPAAIAIVCGIVTITMACITIGYRTLSRLLNVTIVVVMAVSVISATVAVERAIGANSSAPSSTPTVSKKLSSVKITKPDPATPGNPLSSVSCAQPVYVTADIPSDYVVVVANRTHNGSSWYFQEASHSIANAWNTVVHFYKGIIRSYYEIVALAVPRGWADYTRSVFGSVQSASGGGWDFSDLPPSPAATYSETVQLSGSGRSC
jgi:hypothetical protein